MDTSVNTDGNNPSNHHLDPAQTTQTTLLPPPPPGNGAAPGVPVCNDRADRLVYALAHIVTDCRMSAVSQNADGDKLVMPVDTSADIKACLYAHVTGAPIVVRLNGKKGSFEARRSIFGLYTSFPFNGEALARVLVIDVDVAGKDGSHANGLKPDAARKAVAVMLDSLRSCGLNPIRVRSQGGSGWHIWVIFPAPVPAAFAKMIGELAKVDAGLEDEPAVEVFPKSDVLRPDGFGHAITLPSAGRPTGVGGGMIYDEQGNIAADPASTLISSPQSAVDALMAVYGPHALRRAQMGPRKMLVQRFNNQRFGSLQQAPDVPLDVIARELGDMVDDEVSEPGIIKLRCPKHGGDALHVHANPEQGCSWWKCHACNVGGGRERAAITLVRFLQPTCSDQEIREMLLSLSGTRMGGAA